METKDTFVEVGMKESVEMFSAATEATMRPGAIVYERIKPYVERFISKHIIRPLMSPRRLLYT